jgi:hypothetical protein
MDQLMPAHNEVFRIAEGDLKGTYRVVLNELAINTVIAVRLDPDPAQAAKKGGRKKRTDVEKANPVRASSGSAQIPGGDDEEPGAESGEKKHAKKPPLPLLGELLWLDRGKLLQLKNDGHLFSVAIEPDGTWLLPIASEKASELFDSRKSCMKGFLCFDSLRESILLHRSLSGLVKGAMKETGASRALVYKLWSRLCRYGFREGSLRPMFDACGAPGVTRPCDPGGRQKPGRKTSKQRIALAVGQILPPEQPGMTSAWRTRILAADAAIPVPKPDMPVRCRMVLSSHFVKWLKYVDGKLVPIPPEEAVRARKKENTRKDIVAVDPAMGTYPTPSQIRRVLEVDIPRLVRLAQRTTAGHYLRNLRGLVARNWKGVAGPGHTWAIDSTIGDIYLRSSINAAWIIGRPVIYAIVDVWSTAVVGFYVCVHGPSWDMAKLALFSAAADPALLGELWGYQPLLTLSPAPTLPAVLLCDRGEYLSRGGYQTGMKLLPVMSYTPPFRGDLKGVVEVLFRILKDKQRQIFVPGAIDARRAEMELRRFNPNDGVFTIRQLVHFLYAAFTEYNLTANREHRLDAHMRAAGVLPSPAGLWAWGHRMGIGFRRSVQQSDLITTLLQSDTARITSRGAGFAGRHYENVEINRAQWADYARNFGSWEVPCYHFSGSVSRIWTPNVAGQGVLDLRLSDNSTASPELTVDEVADAFMYGQLNRAGVEHERTMNALNAMRHYEALIADAKAKVADALAKDGGQRPTMTAARHMEGAPPSAATSPTPTAPPPSADDAEEAHQKMMKAILEAADVSEAAHG